MQGLYLHIPYCSQRCNYCDFYFVTSSGDRTPYLEALCNEIALYGRRFGYEGVQTVYFGGGTPSLLSLDQVATIMQSVRRHFDLSDTNEVTFELNPEDLQPGYLQGLRSLGITRPSVGIQSLQEKDLQFMNRAHGSAEAADTIAQVRDAGYDKFSVDLIYGVPKQSLSDWTANIRHVIDHGAPHVSAYALTIEENTPLHRSIQRGVITPQRDAHYAAKYEVAIALLEQAGYRHYEISSFAIPGHEAHHNSRYWAHKNYIGMGPSAQSFRWQSDSDVPASRWGNVRSLRRYVTSLENRELPIDYSEDLSMKDLATEHIMLRLRTDTGVHLSEVHDTFGYDLALRKQKEIVDLQANGLLVAGDTIRLSKRGMFLSDSVIASLIP